MTATTEQRIALRFIPKNSRVVEHELGVCYIQDTTRRYGIQELPYFLVMAYTNRANKHSFYEGYQTAERRNKRVQEFFAGLDRRVKIVAERKSEREKPHTLRVGDIIHHSWGWEQTQCDYYQVLAVTPHGATVQAITASGGRR